MAFRYCRRWNKCFIINPLNENWLLVRILFQHDHLWVRNFRKYDTGDYSDIPALHVNGREVLQIDPISYRLIAEFDSMAEAERKTGVSSKQIIKSCRRDHVTSGGFIWCYKNDPDAFVPVEKKFVESKGFLLINIQWTGNISALIQA